MVKKRKSIVILIGTVVVLVLAAVIAANAYVNTYFVRGTQVNGIDVSGKKIDSLKDTVKDYALQITERKAETDSDEDATFIETISGNAIGLKIGSDEPLYGILEKQTIWSIFTGTKQEYELADCLSYDESALEAEVQKLKCLDTDYATAPVNAKPAKYDAETKSYPVTPEQLGNTLDEALALEAVKEAVSKLEESLDMGEADCYVKPEITEDSEEITGLTDQLNKYVSTKITYTFGDATEVLDGDTIHKWIRVDDKGTVSINKKKISNYVAGLRKKYDTIFRNREFETSYGTTVKVEGGDYGWWMNYEQEEKKLLNLIEKGKQTDRVPEYYQKAVAYGEKDYGNTYVEVDLTGQHVFMVKDGKVVLETDCVTGNEARGNGTPQGTYSITYKQRDATLKGENYATPVDYWMPFNGGIGLHDADWRSRFGGTLYKYSGSHGCVNLPPSAAAKLYSLIEQGTPVICYYSDHIVKKKQDSGDKKDTASPTAKPTVAPTAKATVKPAATPKVTATPKAASGTKKKKKKATPKPTKKTKKKATAKPKKKATAKPKKKATAKPAAKATVKPAAKATAKPTAKSAETQKSQENEIE